MKTQLFSNQKYQSLRALQTDLETVQESSHFCLKISGEGDNKYVSVVQGRFWTWIASIASALGFKRYDLKEIAKVVTGQLESLKEIPPSSLNEFSERKLTQTCMKVAELFPLCLNTDTHCDNKPLEATSRDVLEAEITRIVSEIISRGHGETKPSTLLPRVVQPIQASVKAMPFPADIGKGPAERFLQERKLDLVTAFGDDLTNELADAVGEDEKLRKITDRFRLYAERLVGDSPELKKLEARGAKLLGLSSGPYATKGTPEYAAYHRLRDAILQFRDNPNPTLSDIQKVLSSLVEARCLLDEKPVPIATTVQLPIVPEIEQGMSTVQKEELLLETENVCKTLFSQHLKIDIESMLEAAPNIDVKMQLLADVLLQKDVNANFNDFLERGPNLLIKGDIRHVPYFAPEDSLAKDVHRLIENNLHDHDAQKKGGSPEERLKMLQGFAHYLQEAHMLCYAHLDDYASPFDQAQGKRAVLLLELRSYLLKADMQQSDLWHQLGCQGNTRLFSFDRLRNVTTEELEALFNEIPLNKRNTAYDDEWTAHLEGLKIFEKGLSENILKTPTNAGTLEKAVFDYVRHKINSSSQVFFREARYLADITNSDDVVRKQADAAMQLMMLREVLDAAKMHIDANMQSSKHAAIVKRVSDGIEGLRLELYGSRVPADKAFSEKRLDTISRDEIEGLFLECMEVLRPLQDKSKFDKSTLWRQYGPMRRELELHIKKT